MLITKLTCTYSRQIQMPGDIRNNTAFASSTVEAQVMPEDDIAKVAEELRAVVTDNVRTKLNEAIRPTKKAEVQDGQDQAATE